jgi:hypothetical protein
MGVYLLPSCPSEGRIRIVRDAGQDVVDAAASGAQVVAGRDQLRERSSGTLTNDVVAYGEIVWVLTASGLASSSAEAKPARPGAGQPYSRGDGDKQILIAGASTYNP